MRYLFDTSVLVATVVDQLAHDEAAFSGLPRLTRGQHEGFDSTHSMAECHATPADSV